MAAAKKAKQAKQEKAPTLVVVSKVKKSVELRVGGDAIKALSKHTLDVMLEAQDIAKEAGMKTVKADHVERAVRKLTAAPPAAE